MLFLLCARWFCIPTSLAYSVGVSEKTGIIFLLFIHFVQCYNFLEFLDRFFCLLYSSAVIVSLGAKHTEVDLLVIVPFLFGVLALIRFSFLRAKQRLLILLLWNLIKAST